MLMGKSHDGRRVLAGLDISGRIDNASSSTSSPNVNSDVMLDVWIQVVVRACHSQRIFGRERRAITNSIEACLEGFL
jgi:hypothetical protein